ncbi:two-component system regulatory protein YycI [Paenibacillus sediminis]|uniref:Regulatory protein YycI of two-component signal transduction system YycFG n=1 Tax=Paenibacillus sediminis TaxID=664909 RepID=A0ABS4H6S6_9BACL|nr:two-component system regulatory protein YycI [Paenibacillus sediminis]MBP1938233.1 regulatory protein YycI of two-component signal transduction system YycFG [Paenibacillus sediminis]
MDWGRAKNVLIYSFLLLNLILGYQLWMDVKEQASSNLDFTSLAENTQKAMDQKGIQVLAQIPRDTPELQKITYRYLNGDTEREPVKLAEPVDSKLIFSSKELINALKNSIPQIDNHRYDPLLSQDGVFVLHPLVEGEWPLFNVALELYYSNQKITGYRQSLIEVTPSGEKQKVLSASKALGTLIENFLPERSVVKDIQLGYYGQVFNSESQVAAPAWRFILENGEIYYVQGISGDVISPKTEK